MYVIDASVMGPLMFADEADDAVAILPDALAAGECVVPVHWRFELANQLLNGVKRKRITAAEAAVILNRIDRLPVEIDQQSLRNAMTTTYELAGRHGLTIYDAAYLELAERIGASLMTFDQDLVSACARDAVQAISA